MGALSHAGPGRVLHVNGRTEEVGLVELGGHAWYLTWTGPDSQRLHGPAHAKDELGWVRSLLQWFHVLQWREPIRIRIPLA